MDLDHPVTPGQMLRRMRVTWSAGAAAVVLGVLLLACAEHRSQIVARGDADRDSGGQEHRLEVPEAATSLELEIDVQVRTGEIGWTLTDPQGEERARGSLGAGEQLARAQAFDPMAGTWQIQLDLRDLTGVYDFHLRASW